MENKTFRLTGSTIETIGSNGKEAYLIDSISPQGIKVLNQAENGVDIIEHISWDQIKR